MKIAWITPGSGGSFYCQNCIRDNLMAQALYKAGHQIVILPMYLPGFIEFNNQISIAPNVFYGAISVFLEQKLPFLKSLPGWMLKPLNSKPLLKLAAKFSGSTSASSLEDLTLSVLSGEHGNQAKELQQLVDWLEQNEPWDVVHLSNALLIGLAHTIKLKTKAKITCSLQDEDSWINSMSPGSSELAWQLIQEQSQNVDVFFPVSHYYAHKMTARLNIPPEKIKVIYPPVNTDIYKDIHSFKGTPPTIGFMSRMSAALGLGILVDAYLILKSNPSYQNIKLKVIGGYTPADKPFLKTIKNKLSKLTNFNDVTFIETLDQQSIISFLSSISLLSVPVPGGEAFGSYLLEAMACEVPVVQPNVGAYPEIIEATGGGITFEPCTAETLAATIADLLSDHQTLVKLGQQGKNSVLEKFSPQSSIQNFLQSI